MHCYPGLLVMYYEAQQTSEKWAECVCMGVRVCNVCVTYITPPPPQCRKYHPSPLPAVLNLVFVFEEWWGQHCVYTLHPNTNLISCFGWLTSLYSCVWLCVWLVQVQCYWCSTTNHPLHWTILSNIIHYVSMNDWGPYQQDDIMCLCFPKACWKISIKHIYDITMLWFNFGCLDLGGKIIVSVRITTLKLGLANFVVCVNVLRSKDHFRHCYNNNHMMKGHI